ncbi:hypothetical protein, partial [Asticcacaulis sp.]|uniref:hypothetical protein n=1 Tax=Asticcacaulis sp. TaxID=1872648 RepID=UPI002609DEFD
KKMSEKQFQFHSQNCRNAVSRKSRDGEATTFFCRVMWCNQLAFQVPFGVTADKVMMQIV